MLYTDVELDVIVPGFAGGVMCCCVGWGYHSSDYEDCSLIEVALLVISSLLVSFLAYSSMESIPSSETSQDF